MGPKCLVDRLQCAHRPPESGRDCLHTGVSATTVHRVISNYNRWGPAALETPGKGGRRRQYLTLQEEQTFLIPFITRARTGELVTVQEIWRAYAQRVGHEVDDSTIYRLLDRHGWRKLLPRPRHTNSDPQAQEQFKKTFQRRLKQPLPREKLAMNDRS
jgi:transposase